MTEAQIKHMVDRFLMWKLPEHFNPDDGISFDAVFLVDAGSTTFAENLGAIRRAKQVVAFGDPVTQTPSAFRIQAERTPAVPVDVVEDLELGRDVVHGLQVMVTVEPRDEKEIYVVAVAWFEVRDETRELHRLRLVPRPVLES